MDQKAISLSKRQFLRSFGFGGVAAPVSKNEAFTLFSSFLKLISNCIFDSNHVVEKDSQQPCHGSFSQLAAEVRVVSLKEAMPEKYANYRLKGWCHYHALGDCLSFITVSFRHVEINKHVFAVVKNRVVLLFS